MIHQFETENLQCRYAVAPNNRACYILMPQQMDELDLEAWAVRFGYNVVVVSGMNWADDLTPWPAPGLRSGDAPFGGRADDFLCLLTDKVVPAVERRLQLESTGERLLVGVSLSGLFAIWSWMRNDCFDHVVSVSGSFWYDSVAEWIASGGIHPKRGCAYLSIGDKEERSGNTRFRSVGHNTESLAAEFRRQGISTYFDRLPGTHFSPIGPRIEKALETLDSPKSIPRL